MKIDRLIGILSILLQKEIITAPELAEHFEVSRRTIGRDIEALCKAGIPIRTMKGSGGGISIMNGYRMGRTLLTSRDMQMILAGLRSLDSVSGSRYYGQLMEKLQADGKSYSSIHSLRGVLRPAFRMAVDDNLIRKSPFDFELASVIVNDIHTRLSITRDEERKFLKFVKEDPHFCKYYEGIYILFHTGLRISEFCGLTLGDIDFENHKINVDHQLQKRAHIGYYIESTKTTCGTRVLPMTEDDEACFRKIISERNAPRVEPIVDGYPGFPYYDKDGSITYSLHWGHYFKHIVDKYNSIYKLQMPEITPHVCRHTYCSTWRSPA